ncbi:hypothetical protein VPH35_056817 [Triticum aestivum]
MATAACDERENKRAHTASQCWSATFPEDLLVLIYNMITSPRVCTCFAAVCRSWRAASRVAPPLPAAPWLLLSPCDGTRMKALYCLEDGALMDLQVPKIIGGHDGGWVALSVSGLVRIVNLLSGVEVALDEKKAAIVCESPHHARGKKVVILRVVFSAPPTSPKCIIAAVTQKCGIALCRLDRPNNGWTTQGCHQYYNRELVDITFCNGELYGLYKKRELVRFMIGVDKDRAPMVTAEHQLDMQWIDRTIPKDDCWDNTSYIFKLDGKLAMALKTRWLPNIQPFFKVFKLVDICAGKRKTPSKYNWLEVTSLDDHALFLGKSFSKAVHVPSEICGGVERNHIYYSHHCWLGLNTAIPSDKVFLKISNDSSSMTCYKEDDSKNAITHNDHDVKRIMSVGYFVQGGLDGGMWILPPYI